MGENSKGRDYIQEKNVSIVRRDIEIYPNSKHSLAVIILAWGSWDGQVVGRRSTLVVCSRHRHRVEGRKQPRSIFLTTKKNEERRREQTRKRHEKKVRCLVHRVFAHALEEQRCNTLCRTRPYLGIDGDILLVDRRVDLHRRHVVASTDITVLCCCLE